MKRFVVIGRGNKFPIVVRVFKRRDTVETLRKWALIFNEWKHFGLIVLDNF